jgi:hypothetical protein
MFVTPLFGNSTERFRSVHAPIVAGKKAKINPHILAEAEAIGSSGRLGQTRQIFPVLLALQRQNTRHFFNNYWTKRKKCDMIILLPMHTGGNHHDDRY